MLEAYRAAVRRADEADARGTVETIRPDSERTPSSPPESGGRRGPPPDLDARSSIDEYSMRELRAYATWIKSDGLLRTDDELIRELFSALPFARMGVRIRNRLATAIKGLN